MVNKCDICRDLGDCWVANEKGNPVLYCDECEDFKPRDSELTDCVAKNDQTIKFDAGKPQVRLVPSQIVRDIARVREFGNEKYHDPDSWKKVETERYIDALYRHVLLFIDDPYGVDEESGLPHLYHIECNCAFLSEKMKDGFERVPKK